MDQMKKESDQSILIPQDKLLKGCAVACGDLQHKLNIRVREIMILEGLRDQTGHSAARLLSEMDDEAHSILYCGLSVQAGNHLLLSKPRRQASISTGL